MSIGKKEVGKAMNYEDNIKKKIGKNHGFKTPEDFLEPSYKKVMETLPERKPVAPIRRTPWQRMRPYMYLAAMFIGLWATMKIVTQLQLSRQQPVSLDNPPALVAQAIASPEVGDQLNIAQQANDIAIAENTLADYDNFSDFEKDFDYRFTDEVNDIDLDAMRSELAIESPDDDYDYNFDDFYYDYYAYI